jgi:flagellar protein FlaG
MTATIDTQNKPVMPEQLMPALKAADHPSNDIKNEQNNVHSIESAKTNQAEEKETSEQALDAAVKQLNSYVQSINRNLEFNIDNDSGETVVKVIDSETDELIRQIPNEEALSIAKQLDQATDDHSPAAGLLLIKAQA